MKNYIGRYELLAVKVGLTNHEEIKEFRRLIKSENKLASEAVYIIIKQRSQENE